MDTDVLLSAVISPEGASRQLVVDALAGKLALLFFHAAAGGIRIGVAATAAACADGPAASDVKQILDAPEGLCVAVVLNYHWRPTGAHADDDLVIETSVNGHADVVATFNRKDMRAAGARFGFKTQRPGPLA